MKKEEAEQLKQLIDSFVEGSDEPTEVVVANEDKKVAEEIMNKNTEELSPIEVEKLFRKAIPEAFDFTEADIIRSGLTGDRVFLRFKGERRWVPDPDTLEKMGYSFNDVKDITEEEMKKLKEGFGLLSVKLW